MSLFSRVELRFTGAGFPCLDLLSKSDCFLVLHVRTREGQWVECGKTEVVQDSDSPKWKHPIVVPYHFEEVQPLRIVVFDYDTPTTSDYVGEAETTLGRIMGGRGMTQVVSVFDSRNSNGPKAAMPRGSVVVSGMELKSGCENETLRIGLRAIALDKKDWFGKSDPYVCMCRPHAHEVAGFRTGLLAEGSARPLPPPTNANETRQRLWTGPVQKNTLDPVWAVVDIPIPILCGGDKEGRPLVMEVYDWNAVSKHEIIGVSSLLSVADLLLAGQSTRIPLTNPDKVKKSGYTHSGELAITSATLLVMPSLLDYIAGGMQMNLMVAVDFTGSNGDPRDPRSLHFMDSRPGAPLNQYVSALASVGTVLQEYDSDKMFPAFGFGGSYNGVVSHAFPLNLNQSNPEVQGIPGLLAAYQTSLATYALSGPTLFAPIIDTACRVAANSGGDHSQQRFTVLLLMTDGALCDADETIRAICTAATLPLAIVIVGVGNADFSAMEILDGDAVPLAYNGVKCARDCVQFVPFTKFTSYMDGGCRLAAEVLAEIPGQVTGYFTSRGIAPNPRVSAPQGVPGVSSGPAQASMSGHSQ